MRNRNGDVEDGMSRDSSVFCFSDSEQLRDNSSSARTYKTVEIVGLRFQGWNPAAVANVDKSHK